MNKEFIKKNKGLTVKVFGDVDCTLKGVAHYEIPLTIVKLTKEGKVYLLDRCKNYYTANPENVCEIKEVLEVMTPLEKANYLISQTWKGEARATAEVIWRNYKYGTEETKKNADKEKYWFEVMEEIGKTWSDNTR